MPVRDMTLAGRPFPVRVDIPASSAAPQTVMTLVRAQMVADGVTLPQSAGIVGAVLIPDRPVHAIASTVPVDVRATYQEAIAAGEHYSGHDCHAWPDRLLLASQDDATAAALIVLQLDVD